MCTYLVMMASMKVKAGTRSVMAEAKVGELYLIPTYINICIEQLYQSTYTTPLLSALNLKSNLSL